MPIIGLGLRASVLGIRASGFGFRVQGLGDMRLAEALRV